MNNQVKLKKGDWVVMHTCGEATDPGNYGKLWRCETDEYTRGQGVYEQNLVFLEGFSGCFSTDFLQKVNLPDTPPVTTLKKGDRVEHPTRGKGTILHHGELLSIIVLDSGETYEAANIGLERLGISTEETHE